MGGSGRRKRRQRDARRNRGTSAATAAERASRWPAERPENWFERQHWGVRALILLGSVVALVGGHFLLWGAVLPAVGALVGRVPVVSTVTGWLFGGGAVMAWGVVALNHKTAKPETARRLRVVAWVWSAVALPLVPTEYADEIVLPVDFWAGVYAGAYGVALSPVAFGVVASGWWLLVTKPAGRKKEPTKQAIGWICVGYAALLLLWGSTLLRM